MRPTIYPREQHSLSRDHIDPDALKIMYRLIRNGHKAYLVGGGVRDLLLGKTPKDFDIATDATPRKIKSLFRNSRIIGRRFKLAHIFFGDGKIIEVSTFRDFSDPIEPELVEDEEDDDNRRAKRPLIQDNKYGTEVTDALRRDLTINGLFYDLSTFSIIDYVGGMPDLQEGIIRVIGDPDERLKEDPVRMLRVVRHAAKADFLVDPLCIESLARNRGLIVNAAPMRIFEELKKDLGSGHFLKILRLIATTELLEFLLPELLNNLPAIFDDKSALSTLLAEVDTQALEGIAISSACVLAVLLLAQHQDQVAAPDSHHGVSHFKHANLALSAEYFAHDRNIDEFLADKFRSLAVPRRERERIAGLLYAWAYVETAPREKLRRAWLVQLEYFEDLILFAQILQSDRSIVRLLLDMRQERMQSRRRHPKHLPGEDSRSGPRRRRRRGGRSRGSRGGSRAEERFD